MKEVTTINEAIPNLKEFVTEVPTAKTHVKALAEMVCRCTEDEAMAICDAMVEKYPVIMLDSLAERVNFLIGVNQELKGILKKL